jgi:hypothetical protein
MKKYLFFHIKTYFSSDFKIPYLIEEKYRLLVMLVENKRYDLEYSLDSLLAMNSLLQNEGLAGQVQMLYIDPQIKLKEV